MTGNKLINAETFEFETPESGGGYGIDPSNVLASGNKYISSYSPPEELYKATEDCVALCIKSSDSISYLWIDGVQIKNDAGQRYSITKNGNLIPLKKGQILSASRSASPDYVAYVIYGTK